MILVDHIQSNDLVDIIDETKSPSPLENPYCIAVAVQRSSAKQVWDAYLKMRDFVPPEQKDEKVGV